MISVHAGRCLSVYGFHIQTVSTGIAERRVKARVGPRFGEVLTSVNGVGGSASGAGSELVENKTYLVRANSQDRVVLTALLI